ncbi:Ltp family lipoprotein [Staphylococcus shinii]|uniref:Ltp family lipoprotein n=1 Tax=Staphylococcus shinii TaxID=2912228 RepID=UPI001304BD77|nr:Ltp family lipoprotein [Staphylococcus shinii]
MNKDLKNFNSLNNSSYKAKWYERNLVVILALIFIYPVGIALMWNFKKWTFWLRVPITALFVIIYFVSFGGTDENNDKTDNKDLKTELEATKSENKDLKSDIKDLEDKENDTTNIAEETNKETNQQEKVTTTEESKTESDKEEDTGKANREEKAALDSAETYSDMMHMSKAGIYDQLTSSAGDKYPDNAAQYAVDNLKANYKNNALESAKNYIDMMDMSDDELYDQLTSDAGDKFTEEEAQYAVDHLED